MAITFSLAKKFHYNSEFIGSEFIGIIRFETDLLLAIENICSPMENNGPPMKIKSNIYLKIDHL